MVKKQRKNKPQNGQARKAMRGHEIKVNPMPPIFTSRPWFNLTVAVTTLPAVSMTNINLATALANQIFLPVAAVANITLRLYTVKVWSPLVAFNAATTLQPFRLQILDPISQNSTIPGIGRILEEYTRYPDQVNRACVGYKYPIAQSDLAILSSETVPLLNYNATSTGGLAIFTLSFRLTGAFALLSDEDPKNEVLALETTDSANKVRKPRSWFSD